MAEPGREDVNEFLGGIEHPLISEIRLAREIILSADERISEGIKWKVPSFFYNDWFATFHVRTQGTVQIIFHTGAKVKASSIDGLNIEDPDRLMKWLAKDRCLVDLGTDVEAKREALIHIVQQWITHL